MKERFENFTSIVYRINKDINKIKSRAMERFGLKSIHVMCLFYISHHETVTNSMLVKLTGEDKAAISRALAVLEENEYVKCDTKYKSPIILLEKGKEVASYIDYYSEKAVSFAGDFLSPEERQMLYDMLFKICVNLDKYVEIMGE